MIRASDEEGSEFKTGFNRVLSSELHDAIKPTSELKYIGTKFWDVKRGRELDTGGYFETDASDTDVVEGCFFSSAQLPENVMEHHMIMIPEIFAAFFNYMDAVRSKILSPKNVLIKINGFANLMTA